MRALKKQLSARLPSRSRGSSNAGDLVAVDPASITVEQQSELALASWTSPLKLMAYTINPLSIGGDDGKLTLSGCTLLGNGAGIVRRRHAARSAARARPRAPPSGVRL